MEAALQINKSKKGITKEARIGFVLALVPVLGFFIFSFIPIVLAIVMSFMKIKGFNFNGAELVGIQNFQFLLQDAKFYKSIKIRIGKRYRKRNYVNGTS